MKLLITGGAGFVGTRLAQALLARGTLGGRRIGQLVLADLAAPRADVLADPRVREAIGLALDFEWMNRQLFFGAYTRVRGFFTALRPRKWHGPTWTATSCLRCSAPWRGWLISLRWCHAPFICSTLYRLRF